GSGETDLGSHDPDSPIDPQVFDDQVVAAYEQLLAQPEVDPERTVALGHSEGALYALRLHQLVPDASPAVVLAAPPGTRYMDLIDRQLTEQVRTMESTGAIAENESVNLLSDARAARASVREGHALPDDLDPTLESVYAPQNTDFLAAMDALDPVDLAEDLPSQTSVLVLWGEEDDQVLRQDVDRLMDGFVQAERVDLPRTDHVFREHEDTPGAVPRLYAGRPFSPDGAPALADFLDTVWWTRAPDEHPGLRIGVRRWERWEILALQKEGSQGFDETPGDFLHPGENVFLVRGPCCFVVGSGAVTRRQVEVGHTRAHTGDGERTSLDPQGGVRTDVAQSPRGVP